MPNRRAAPTKNARRCCKHHAASATILSVPLPTHSRALAARVDQYQQCTGANIELAPYEVQCSGEAYCGGFAGLFEIGVGALEDAKGASYRQPGPLSAIRAAPARERFFL